MDISTITGAYEGLKATRDILTGLFEAKVEAEAKPKIIEAQARLGQALDTLFALREELFRLQEEGNKLRKELDEVNAWKARFDGYTIEKTEGGAIVYKSTTEPEHFACPSCINKREIQILQPNRTITGKFRCTGCKAEFPIEPRQPIEPLPTTHHWK